jgi:hypothetical protein
MGCAWPPLELQQGAGAAPRQRLQRLAPAGGIDGDRRQEVPQLRRRAGIETAVGALGEPGDLAEGALGARVGALLEQKHRHAEQSQLAGATAQVVDVLLHAVADIDQRVDRLLCRLGSGVAQHLADLRVAARAIDSRHQARERVGVRHPLGGAALAGATKVDELHIEPADRLDGVEHVGLQRQRHVPGRLAAHGGIHSEHEPAAPRRRPGPQLLHAAHELGNVGIGRSACNGPRPLLAGQLARRRRSRTRHVGRPRVGLRLAFAVAHARSVQGALSSDLTMCRRLRWRFHSPAAMQRLTSTFAAISCIW